jgi:ubiquinone biosynthesis accessory factor UbiJ
MLDELRALAGDAVLARATLLANHVIGAEPAAMERLRPHAGRRIELQFDGWPALLPPLPPIAFTVTPAGLLERGHEEADAALRVSLDASNPAKLALQSLAGERPPMTIAGDAAFAGDIQWLVDHLRWDVQDDLERLVGPGPAREIARLAGGAADALRRAAQSLAGSARRDPAAPPPP